MGAYDESLDKEIWSDSFPTSDTTTLPITVHQYNGKDPKIQIGPRTWLNKDEILCHQKLGRLSRDEALWVAETIEKIVEEVIDVMK